MLPGGRRGFHTACRPLPPCKRLASAIRARHGRHGKLTLYRDAAGAEPVSSMATGSEEEARKTLYCLFSG